MYQTTQRIKNTASKKKKKKDFFCLTIDRTTVYLYQNARKVKTTASTSPERKLHAKQIWRTNDPFTLCSALPSSPSSRYRATGPAPCPLPWLTHHQEQGASLWALRPYSSPACPTVPSNWFQSCSRRRPAASAPCPREGRAARWSVPQLSRCWVLVSAVGIQFRVTGRSIIRRNGLHESLGAYKSLGTYQAT